MIFLRLRASCLADVVQIWFIIAIYYEQTLRVWHRCFCCRFDNFFLFRLSTFNFFNRRSTSRLIHRCYFQNWSSEIIVNWKIVFRGKFYVSFQRLIFLYETLDAPQKSPLSNLAENISTVLSAVCFKESYEIICCFKSAFGELSRPL